MCKWILFICIGSGDSEDDFTELPDCSDHRVPCGVERHPLVGKRIRFKWDEPWGWSEGIVLKVADGKMRMSKKCRKVLEYDWAYIQYGDKTEPYWNQLRAGWFNTEKRAAWKLLVKFTAASPKRMS